MANEQRQPNRQASTETLTRLGQERERLRMRALDLKRQRQVLENEMQSSGIAESQRAFLSQRLQTLSNDEDQLSLKLAQTERQLTDAERSIKKGEREESDRRLRRQSILSIEAQRLSGQIVGTPTTVQRVQRIAAAYERSRQEREKSYARLSRLARKAALLIVIAAFVVAGLADFLSVFSLGWIVSWSLPIILWLIARRIRGMDRSVDLIKTAQQTAQNEYQILLQRTRLALVETGQIKSYLGVGVMGIKQKTSSYIVTLARDQIIAQIIELIPALNAILPMYLASVVKIIIDQQRAYRKAKQALIPYRQILDLLASLEQFDIDYQMGIIPSLQKSTTRRVAPRITTSTARSNPTVRDIGRPAMALSPA